MADCQGMHRGDKGEKCLISRELVGFIPFGCILEEEEEERSSNSVLFDRTVAAEDNIRQSRGGGINIACHSGFHWCISIPLHKLTKSRLVMLRHDMTHTHTHTAHRT